MNRLSQRYKGIEMRNIMGLLAIFLSSLSFAQSPDKGKNEAEELMNSLIPFAEKMLSQNGEFFPYGATIKSDGKIALAAGFSGSEQPQSQEVIDLLHQAFKTAAKTKQCKATGLVYDVRVTLPESGEKSDALAIELDHASGYSVLVYVPYKIEKSKVNFGVMFTNSGRNAIFTK